MYTIAVRELCEFTAKQGDLDLRFTPAPSSQEGIAGHQIVAARRGPDYRSEVSLVGEHRGLLKVRGRADGFDKAAGRVEEVKTYKGRLDRQPESHRRLHWAQARIYGALLCRQEQLQSIEVALVYFDIARQEETLFSERWTAAELERHFEEHCERFLAWAQSEMAHRQVRDAALQSLTFPFDGGFRTGQRPLAENVYKAAASGRCLLAQAPTGIGKTLGTIFPLLKAMPGPNSESRLDKLFFLAAKTSGRQVALDALARLPGSRARVLEIVARDKACEHPDLACHGESCPKAQGFYDRLPAARAAAMKLSLMDRAAVRATALEHEVCPYYLSQELARWADVVVGDYNYYFDFGGLLHGLALSNQWRVGLLVDEAHNLVDRGRKMYTTELHPDSLAAARRSPAARKQPALKKALDKVRRAWIAMDKAQPDGATYQLLESVPANFQAALTLCTSALTEHMAEHPTEPDADLQHFCFEALHLARLAELLDEHSLVDLSLGAKPGSSVLCIRNIVPAPFLKPRLELAHTSTLFSATLQPAHYYADLLGLPETHAVVDVDSPFEAAQLQVRVARHVSTRYQHRGASLDKVVALLAAQFRERPGNYLAFFSSYEYLQQVADRFSTAHPDLPCWQQERRMSEAAQKDFLSRFTDSSQGIAFAVLGGAFSEGIDLPGRRLIGAFLLTLGLPQLNPVNEQIRERMEKLFGAGYDYTYLYPGMQKVVQAAGRVIRTPEDRGVVHLIDDRFARREVQALLPLWWRADTQLKAIANGV